MDNLYTVKQIAFLLKVHPLSVRRYIREGKLKAIKSGGNVRITESELQGFNKELMPGEKNKAMFMKNKSLNVKTFTVSDPFFQLKGRGATLHILNSS